MVRPQESVHDGSVQDAGYLQQQRHDRVVRSMGKAARRNVRGFTEHAGAIAAPRVEHGSPQHISQVLEEHCGISLQHFMLTGMDREGQLFLRAGPNFTEDAALSQFINLKGYMHWHVDGQPPLVPQVQLDTVPPRYPQFQGANFDDHVMIERRSRDRRRAHEATEAVSHRRSASARKKRIRGSMPPREAMSKDHDLPVMAVTSVKKGIRIGDEAHVWEFCDQRFRNIQQTACKLISKAWVKLVAPKKQSNHPYTGADAKAPDWWPKPWGPSKDDRVRHKEPDHLYKPERLHLLNHILRMIVTPNHLQHPDIQKLNLNVVKLEEVTMDALSSFFGDADNPGNARKKLYLKEIFRVARHREKYENDEIDADTQIYVSADDKTTAGYHSEDEDGLGDDRDEVMPHIKPDGSRTEHDELQNPPAGMIGGPEPQIFVEDDRGPHLLEHQHGIGGEYADRNFISEQPNDNARPYLNSLRSHPGLLHPQSAENHQYDSRLAELRQSQPYQSFTGGPEPFSAPQMYPAWSQHSIPDDDIAARSFTSHTPAVAVVSLAHPHSDSGQILPSSIQPHRMETQYFQQHYNSPMVPSQAGMYKSMGYDEFERPAFHDGASGAARPVSLPPDLPPDDAEMQPFTNMLTHVMLGARYWGNS